MFSRVINSACRKYAGRVARTNVLSESNVSGSEIILSFYLPRSYQEATHARATIDRGRTKQLFFFLQKVPQKAPFRRLRSFSRNFPKKKISTLLNPKTVFFFWSRKTTTATSATSVLVSYRGDEKNPPSGLVRYRTRIRQNKNGLLFIYFPKIVLLVG